MQLVWDGDITTDERYAIGRMTSAAGEVTFFLERSPLFVAEEREVEVEPVLDGAIVLDAAGEPIPFEDRPWPTRLVTVVVRDDTPRGSGDREVVRQQAQAIEDGTLDEFEEARAGVLRRLRAEKAERDAAAAQALAVRLRAESDAGVTTPSLSEAQMDALRREQEG